MDELTFRQNSKGEFQVGFSEKKEEAEMRLPP
jgi:hypothetical protein